MSSEIFITQILQPRMVYPCNILQSADEFTLYLFNTSDSQRIVQRKKDIPKQLEESGIWQELVQE